MTKTSVIIPFHNDLENLQKCLEALSAQTYPTEDFEIIAVDNGSLGNSDKIKVMYPRVRWLTELQPGSYAARNMGVLHARGSILAFTDADCIPSSKWLHAAITSLEETKATIIGGRIDYVNRLGQTLNIYELFEEEFFLLGKQKYLVDKLGVAATANLVAYKAVFDRVGLFTQGLMSFGDGEWTQRATSKGEVLRYTDFAVVYHPRRNTFRGIFRKARRLAGGRTVLLMREKEPVGHLVADIYRYSILNPRVHRYAFRFPNIKDPIQKLKMFFLVEFLSLANTFEKIRALLGAGSYRG